METFFKQTMQICFSFFEKKSLLQHEKKILQVWRLSLPLVLQFLYLSWKPA